MQDDSQLFKEIEEFSTQNETLIDFGLKKAMTFLGLFLILIGIAVTFSALLPGLSLAATFLIGSFSFAMVGVGLWLTEKHTDLVSNSLGCFVDVFPAVVAGSFAGWALFCKVWHPSVTEPLIWKLGHTLGITIYTVFVYAFVSMVVIIAVAQLTKYAKVLCAP